MATTMNNEYLALTGKISFRNGWLNEKKFNIDTHEGFYRFISFIFLTGLLAYLLYELINDKSYGNLVLIIISITWLWRLYTKYYKSIFILVWRTNIPLNEIEEIHSVELENGVETKVVLKLKNGRIKEILFRNAENQLEPFMNDLSAFLSRPVSA